MAETDHIDKFLESDGVGAIVASFLFQLLDLVRMDLVAEFRRLQHGTKILPGNLSESFRIKLEKSQLKFSPEIRKRRRKDEMNSEWIRVN